VSDRFSPARARCSALDVPHPSLKPAPTSARSIAPPHGRDQGLLTRVTLTCLERPLRHSPASILALTSQNPAIEFAGLPSPVLANSGDLGPPGARTCLALGDFTTADRSSGTRSHQPLLAFDLSRPAPIQRSRSLDSGSHERPLPLGPTRRSPALLALGPTGQPALTLEPLTALVRYPILQKKLKFIFLFFSSVFCAIGASIFRRHNLVKQ
jgi:hypothetical protein